MRILALLSALIAMTSCTDTPPHYTTVDVSVRNSSPNAYWVKMRWAGPDIPVGILSPAATATSVGVPWPNVPTAEILLVDDKSRQNLTLSLDLAKVNEAVRTGKCKHVTIRILSSEAAEAVCEQP
jgi:hypothetical protein